jgi:hypothetical protein
MKEKIKRLAASPVFVSETDMESFIRLTGQTLESLEYLKEAKKIIIKMYLNKDLHPEDEEIVDRALYIVYGGADDESERVNETDGATEIESQNENIANEDIDRNVLREVVTDIAKLMREDSIYIGKGILSNKKYENFKNVYQFAHTLGEPLVFIDCTVLGSGKNAVVLTENGIHSHGDWSSSQKDGFTKWKVFLQNEITTDISFEIGVGGNHLINVSGAGLLKEEIVFFLEKIHERLNDILRNGSHSENGKAPEQSLENVQQDLNMDEMLKDPFVAMGRFVKDNFIYVSPVYAITLHFATYNLGSMDDEDNHDELLEMIQMLSDKHRLEEIIVNAEKSLLTLFSESIRSIRVDIENIVGGDIGNIFAYDKKVLLSLQQEMVGYRNVLIGKMNEMHGYAQQLKTFWIQNEEGTGKFMKEFIKGGALGVMGASLFGPIGIAAAIGATYFGSNEEAKKKEAMLEDLYQNWSKAHDMFYFSLLSDYYELYDNFTQKIAQQYVANYQLAYKFAIENDKKEEYENYIKEEIHSFIYNDEYKKMREELSELKNFIKGD